jgi:4a-hydroxytetrahydrobiopterin dehydratase
MTMPLADKSCVPCQGGTPALRGQDLQALLRELGNGWAAIRDHHLEREFPFRNFREALAFTNAVGAIAEQEGHHPEITLSWGKAVLRIWTHKIDGLTESDFVLAAKADRAYPPQPERPLP